MSPRVGGVSQDVESKGTSGSHIVYPKPEKERQRGEGGGTEVLAEGGRVDADNAPAFDAGAWAA